MEIKRKFDLLIETNRRYVIRQSAPRKQVFCSECGAPVLATEQAAEFFGVKQRRIFQIIEIESPHFTETETGAAMICLQSLASILDAAARINNQLDAPLDTADAV